MDRSSFQKLTFLEKYFDDPKFGIPNESGIYYWVYWPSFPKNVDINTLESKLIEYSTKKLAFSETLSGQYKFEAIVSERWYKDNGNIFGLSDIKKNRLLRYFKEDPANISLFLNFFERVCFTRPFYIGKANNLRTRLVNGHFKSNSEIIPQIEISGIPKSDIYVGYELMNDTSDQKINVIFEEIFSRIAKPGLTKKAN